MNLTIKSIAATRAAALLACALLASCGGSDSVDSRAASAPPPPLQLATMSKSSAAVAADYTDVVQRVYVSYFGRPADPAGLAYFANLYASNGAPTTIQGVISAYGPNPVITELINNFGTSDESKALYPGDNASFLSAIYRNLFSRDPDAAGLAYWVGALDAKNVTRAQAAVTIMGAAQGTDATLISAKIAAAITFTNALNNPARKAAYDGLAANVVARTMLGGVSTATAPATVAASVEAAINTLTGQLATQLYPAVASIMAQRCAGCHSAKPTIPGFNPAPNGIRYDTSEQIHADAERIYNAAVVKGSMPYGNMTQMTDAERAVIANWFTKGAP